MAALPLSGKPRLVRRGFSFVGFPFVCTRVATSRIKTDDEVARAMPAGVAGMLSFFSTDSFERGAF
jgi:hypothetical protein